MEFTWTTFAFEIINFLVLVWLLHRFLYKPVLGVIDRRRRRIEEALAHARDTRQQAGQQAEQYRRRLADWEAERARQRDQLRDELAAERQRGLEAVRRDLAAEREKAQARQARERQDFARRAERQALALAGRFAARLLERLASPELERRLAEVLLEDLDHLDEAQRRRLRDALGTIRGPVRVASAHRLPEARRRELSGRLDDLAGRALDYEFVEEPALQAGLRLSVGHWVLGANLADELSAFSEEAHERGMAS